MSHDKLSDTFNKVVLQLVEEWSEKGLSEEEVAEKLSSEKIEHSIKEVFK